MTSRVNLIIFKYSPIIVIQMKIRVLFILFLVYVQPLLADISLPNIFSNDMVIQRESEVRLFGWASPNEEFEIYTGWNDRTFMVKTGNDAKWELLVNTPEAGGPYEVRFKGNSNEIVLSNVMTGDVWLCSGQSNMEWSANSGIDNKQAEISNANYPGIRLFTVEKRTAPEPQENAHGEWTTCSPETMMDFSAVAYFFAKRVYQETNVPIGLIDASWGASCAEVWTPEDVFEKYPELLKAHESIKPNKWVTIEPSSLYNGMIAPFVNFKIAGVLWYQGESNTANADSYKDLFTRMITSWRNARGYVFPFYFVQIAPFKYGRQHEGAEVRNQQRLALELEKTGMVVTSDICTVDDIHPQNKQDVGLRLANIALKEYYGITDNEVHSPLYKNIEIKDREVIVRFDHNQGLYSTGKTVSHFEIAGEDDVYYPAKARIKDEMVYLSAKQVRMPKHVRFAWENTAIPNLFNSANLPASTFKSN